MSSELNLVKDLAVILIASGVFTILSKVLKQPLILGYIVAGFLIGPKLHLFADLGITDEHSVHQWSEIGIIFLLFGLGLEFSFRKLLKVGSAALITALLNCLGMFFVGLLTGTAMGWGAMESIFLGGMLSMSSTTIIIKAYSEMGLKDKPYAPLVFGILVVEDLIAVLLMVLLSTLAASNSFSGGEMVFSLAKLIFFLILWFLVGIYVIPTLLGKFRSYLSDEILLLVSIGLSFAMVSIALSLGFSSALGAFVMGSILSETIEGERIARLTAPLKDLFGAVFFVSVGMMVDPAAIAKHWLPILIIILVVMVFMFLFTMIGSSLSGKGLNTSTHTAMSLLQLGEFSFIIAGMGVSLGVLRDFISPVIITVSVVTTFTTPYMIKAADPMERFLRRVLPQSLLSRIDKEDGAQRLSTKKEQNLWLAFLKVYAIRVLLYSVLLTAIAIASQLYLTGLVEKLLPSLSAAWRGWLVAVVTLGVMVPFLYGLAISGKSIKKRAAELLRGESSEGLGRTRRFATKWVVLALILLRILIAISFAVSVLQFHVNLSGWTLFGVAVLLLLIFSILRTRFHSLSSLEDHFFANLNQKELEERKVQPVTTSVQRKLADFDVHVRRVKVPEESAFAGKELRELHVRTQSGANIIKILRGKKSILIPTAQEVIFPGDMLLAIGTTQQLAAFSEMMSEVSEGGNDAQQEFSLECFSLDESSFLTGKSLRELRLRDMGCLVVGIVRSDEMITNPSADLCFEVGDNVWIAGAKSSVAWFGAKK